MSLIGFFILELPTLASLQAGLDQAVKLHGLIPTAGSGGADEPAKAARVAAASAELWSRSIRARHFVDHTLGDPMWSILLTIYVSEAQGRRSSITSLSGLAGVARSTGLRWVSALIDQGRIVSEPDPHDRRRQWCRLSATSVRAIESYLDDLIQSPRHHGYLKVVTGLRIAHAA